MNYKNEHGFTLVELAISMMIIGLLVGGILKGQEIIENARVTRIVIEMKNIKTAVAGFRAAYGGNIPGSISNPSDVLPDCAVSSPCGFAGPGGHRIQPLLTGALPSLQPSLPTFLTYPENRNFWLHLQKAGLVKEIVDPTGAAVSVPFAFGVEMPKSAIRNAGYAVLTIGFSPGVGTPVPYSPRLDVSMVLVSAQAGDLPLRAIQAAQLDRKIDDGLPYVGDLYIGGGNCAVSATSNSQYNEGLRTARCEVLYSLGF